MYYFLKTELVKKEVKVRPLESQTFYDGEEIDSKLFVSCNKYVREAYPVGTIFFCTDLKKVATGGYYITRTLSYLDPTDTDSIALAAYKTYEENIKALKDEVADIEEKTEAKKADASSESKPATMRETIEGDKALSSPTPSKDSFFVEKDKWTLLVRNIKNHTNTMIIGPTGTGKTSVVKMLCDKLGLKLHVFDMGSMVDPISSLLGVHRLEDGKSVFDYAKFTQVIQEPCVILLDELSRAAYSTMNILFPCLDDRRKLSIEIAAGKGVREIKVHPDVTFIATANVGAEYTGTNSMDRALTNRFFPIELGNIPNDAEKAVLMYRSGIEKEPAAGIVKVATTLRSLYAKQELSSCISIRETLLVSDMVRDGWELRKAMELVYLPLFEGTSTEGERSTVYKTIASY